jgi:hypothetical protein
MMVTGINTDVDRNGHVYHVQSEGGLGTSPAVETLVYSGGEILVRMRASYEELAARWSLSGNDLRHVLELQHWNLVRKIKHGMLDDDNASCSSSAPPDRTAVGDATECDDPSVRQLLAQLEVKIEEAKVRSERRPKPESATVGRRRSRRWLPLALVLRW